MLDKNETKVENLEDLLKVSENDLKTMKKELTKTLSAAHKNGLGLITAMLTAAIQSIEKYDQNINIGDEQIEMNELLLYRMLTNCLSVALYECDLNLKKLDPKLNN